MSSASRGLPESYGSVRVTNEMVSAFNDHHEKEVESYTCMPKFDFWYILFNKVRIWPLYVADDDGALADKCGVCFPFCKTVIGVSILLILVANLFAMGILGIWHVTDCPANEMIPVFLIVHLILILLAMCIVTRKHMLTFWLCAAVLLAWFIYGSYETYRIYKPEYDKALHPSNYCHEILYVYTYCFFCVTYTVAALILAIRVISCIVGGRNIGAESTLIIPAS